MVNSHILEKKVTIVKLTIYSYTLFVNLNQFHFFYNLTRSLWLLILDSKGHEKNKLNPLKLFYKIKLLKK